MNFEILKVTIKFARARVRNIYCTYFFEWNPDESPYLSHFEKNLKSYQLNFKQENHKNFLKICDRSQEDRPIPLCEK